MNLDPNKHKHYILTIVLMLHLSSLATWSQVTSSTSSNGTMTPKVARAQDAINKVLLESGTAFREGLLAYVDDNRQIAGEKFNKSVEVFLISSLDLQKESKLKGCYDQLIETVYRIEVPSKSQLPQFGYLAALCGWNVEVFLTDNVTKVVSESLPLRESGNGQTIELLSVARLANPRPLSSPMPTGTTSRGVGGPVNPSQRVQGFAEQIFEPSPLDELSKLEVAERKLNQGNKVRMAPPVVKTPDFELCGVQSAPRFRNLQLGMAPTTVEKLLKKKLELRDDTSVIGIRRRKAIVNGLAGLEFLSLRFLNNRLDGLTAFYPQPKTPLSLQSFRDSIRKIFDLPDNINWDSSMFGTSFSSLSCRTFSINGYLDLMSISLNTRDSISIDDASKKPLADSSNRKPMQAKDGKVAAVMEYFNETLDDPYSMKFVRWSPLTQQIRMGVTYWSVTVKYRAKNTVGAYVLFEKTFYMRNNKVVASPDGVSLLSYVRPNSLIASTSNILIVKAKAGDTVQKVAERNGANPTEVAKLNGLLPNSVLGAGREIKIPSK